MPTHPDKQSARGTFVPRWVLVAVVAFAAVAILTIALLGAQLSRNAGRSELTTGDPAKPLHRKQKLLDVRLPTSMVPEHYDIELKPRLEPHFDFDGRVVVHVRVQLPTDNITLHINNMTIGNVEVSGDSKSVPGIVSTDHDTEREFYIIRLDGKLTPGHLYSVAIKYKGFLNDQLVGFYRSSYKDENGKTRWLATTQFQPVDARRAFPCFDEPGLKATFNISITRLKNMNSLSNMPISKSVERDDGWVTDHFETTVKMSTYLLAFVVSDFKGRGTDKFKVWSKESVIDSTDYALQIGPKILEFYNNFFGIEYPIPKMDMAAIPDFSAGAMENWGLILYREVALLHDPRHSSSSNKQRIATVISHEIAHQWFGNLVTPAWWDDLWLNEGFASYVEYLGVAAVEKSWRMEQQFVLDELQNVLELDSLKTSHPISLPVRHPDEINEIFDKVSYQKGASIIRMMRFFLGEENFRRGLMNYLNAKHFNNAVQDDLWEHLTKIQREDERIDVKKVMDSWTLQTGYPVVKFTRNYDDGTASITQVRFLLEPDSNKSDENPAWEVPITYTDGRNPDWEPKTKLWLHRNNASISNLPSRNDWLIANLQQVGYYRVNYDDHNWGLLVSQLQQNHKKINNINRAQIMDDVLDLAKAGHLDYGLALNATLYLDKEEDYIPWKAVESEFSFIDSMLCRSAIYGKWKKYILHLLKPTYDRLGWNESPDEDILTQRMRVTVIHWLCDYNHPHCIQTVQNKYSQWTKDMGNQRIVPVDLRGVVLCSAVANGGEEAWDFMWEQYNKSDVASEKNRYMSALSCAKEPWLISRLLNRSISDGSGIRRQDGSAAFGNTGYRLYGRDIAFNYLRDKWTHIFNKYGKSFFAISRLVKSVTSSLNTRFEIDQLLEFYSKQESLGTAQRAFEQALETGKANVRWMDNHYPVIAKWLETAPGV